MRLAARLTATACAAVWCVMAILTLTGSMRPPAWLVAWAFAMWAIWCARMAAEA